MLRYTAWYDVSTVANAVSWMTVGPAHYFTAPKFQRFEPEGHSAVTHEFDKLRLVVIPEVPRRPEG